MSDEDQSGRVALDLATALIGALHQKMVLSNKELMSIFEIAASHFEVGSPEYETLQNLAVTFGQEESPDH